MVNVGEIAGLTGREMSQVIHYSISLKSAHTRPDNAIREAMGLSKNQKILRPEFSQNQEKVLLVIIGKWVNRISYPMNLMEIAGLSDAAVDTVVQYCDDVTKAQASTSSIIELMGVSQNSKIPRPKFNQNQEKALFIFLGILLEDGRRSRENDDEGHETGDNACGKDGNIVRR